MSQYPKIDTLFERDERFQLMVGTYRRPVFGTIKKWSVTEKIDGTNIRLIFARAADGNTVVPSVRGRTNNASIPGELLLHCQQVAESILPQVTKIMDAWNLGAYVLYGEGYGPKIQKGGDLYRSDQGFILFDVKADHMFLSDEKVGDTADELGLPVVPTWEMGLRETVEMVRTSFLSQAARDVRSAEGVVARTVEPLYDNKGRRCMWKLKTKDFAEAA